MLKFEPKKSVCSVLEMPAPLHKTPQWKKEVLENKLHAISCFFLKVLEVKL